MFKIQVHFIKAQGNDVHVGIHGTPADVAHVAKCLKDLKEVTITGPVVDQGWQVLTARGTPADLLTLDRVKSALTADPEIEVHTKPGTTTQSPPNSDSAEREVGK